MSFLSEFSATVGQYETFGAGAIAGAITGILTTPFDVLKTRLMTQGSSGTYRNVGDCTTKIWQQEGWKTFFKVHSPERHLSACGRHLRWHDLTQCVHFQYIS